MNQWQIHKKLSPVTMETDNSSRDQIGALEREKEPRDKECTCRQTQAMKPDNKTFELEKRLSRPTKALSVSKGSKHHRRALALGVSLAFNHLKSYHHIIVKMRLPFPTIALLCVTYCTTFIWHFGAEEEEENCSLFSNFSWSILALHVFVLVWHPGKVDAVVGGFIIKQHLVAACELMWHYIWSI